MRGLFLLAALLASAPAGAERSPASPDPMLCAPTESNRSGRACSDAEIAAWDEKLYGDTEGVIVTFATAAARGFTVGASDIALRWMLALLGELDGIGNPDVIAGQRRANPRSSTAGTILGFALLVAYVGRWLIRRRRIRASRRYANAIPVVEAKDGSEIVGSFVTRDGYEFAVTRDGRVLEVMTGSRNFYATAVDTPTN